MIRFRDALHNAQIASLSDRLEAYPTLLSRLSSGISRATPINPAGQLERGEGAMSTLTAQWRAHGRVAHTPSEDPCGEFH
jgi:hypothetical protein